MIKTFEEFNDDFLCEAYKLKRPRIITNLNIYSEHDDDCICKTWEDVLKLFSNPKYNDQCVITYKHSEKTHWYRYDSVLNALEKLEKNDNILEIYIYNGVIYINNKKENLNLYILNDNGKLIKKETIDLSNPKYHVKIRIDLLDWYNDTSNFDENTKDNNNDNVIKDLTLYDDFPHNDNKPTRTWQDTIQLIKNSKYDVKCAVVSLDKSGYGDYKYVYDNKEYRYKNRHVRKEESILDELERINSQFSVKYKKLSICDGAIVFTAQVHNVKYIFLICPLNEHGRKILSFENKDILDPKYRIMIEQDILDDNNTTTDKYIQKIKTLSSKEDIDSILKNAFKSTTQEQYSIISACVLCREIELGIWEPTDINGEDIIKAIKERFGFTYTENK